MGHAARCCDVKKKTKKDLLCEQSPVQAQAGGKRVRDIHRLYTSSMLPYRKIVLTGLACARHVSKHSSAISSRTSSASSPHTITCSGT